MNREREQGESPILRLAEDRSLLEEKLKEYKGRIDQYIAPERQIGTIYKIEILKALLEHGEVNTYDLSRKLHDRFGVLDVEKFNNACGVIDDYIKTGGKNLSGGTGLPKRENELKDDGRIT